MSVQWRRYTGRHQLSYWSWGIPEFIPSRDLNMSWFLKTLSWNFDQFVRLCLCGHVQCLRWCVHDMVSNRTMMSLDDRRVLAMVGLIRWNMIDAHSCQPSFWFLQHKTQDLRASPETSPGQWRAADLLWRSVSPSFLALENDAHRVKHTYALPLGKGEHHRIATV